MELIDFITDLLINFDEMGFAPTTTCPNPEAYAIEWRNKITKAFKELTEENERLREKADRNLNNLKAVLEERNENAIVADTVRKMQDKVRKKINKTDWLNGRAVYLAIDQIAKELIGDTK